MGGGVLWHEIYMRQKYVFKKSSCVQVSSLKKNGEGQLGTTGMSILNIFFITDF